MIKKACNALRTLTFNFFHFSRFSLNSTIGKNLYLKASFKKKNITVGKHFFARNNCGIISSGILSIGDNVFLNQNVFITCLKHIIIGDNVSIANNVVIVDHNHSLIEKNKYESDDVVIENNVWIGANSVILKGVHIGHDSVIAAGSIVTKDIPPNTVFMQKRMNTFNEK